MIHLRLCSSPRFQKRPTRVLVYEVTIRYAGNSPSRKAKDAGAVVIQTVATTDTVYTALFDQGWPDAPHRALRRPVCRADPGFAPPLLRSWLNWRGLSFRSRYLATFPSEIPLFARDLIILLKDEP
jgi:hypothetical protein